MISDAAKVVEQDRQELTDWLFQKALPLWWKTGADHEHGGFFEKIDRRGQVIEEPRRTRVVGRQIYSYATASKLGWHGPADEAVRHGLSYLKRCAIRPDGLVVSSSRPDGSVVRADFDLYDHAFALFGLAAAAGISGSGAELAQIAEKMLSAMRAGWAHPVAGFEETFPRTLPLKANPHMHIFEAALAWVESGHARENSPWLALADEIGTLCLDKFLHPRNGCLREFFNGDWSAYSGDEGRIVEPGHQFEWGWLLIRWGLLARRPGSPRPESPSAPVGEGAGRGGNVPLMENNEQALNAARRLIEIAETHGTDPQRGVAFNEIWDDCSPKDTASRLWQQTERIKAWWAMSWIADTEAAREQAIERVSLAAAGLKKYLWTADVAGAWNERMRADGSFLDEPSPASSLYHITCAIAEMHRAHVAG